MLGGETWELKGGILGGGQMPRTWEAGTCEVGGETWEPNEIGYLDTWFQVEVVSWELRGGSLGGGKMARTWEVGYGGFNLGV